MLTRLDLAKKFELVVLQEIKNYKDESHMIYQSLNQLREQIEALESKRKEDCNKYKSCESHNNITFERIYSKIQELQESFLRKFDDVRKEVDGSLKITASNSIKNAETVLDNRCYDQKISHLNSQIDKIRSEMTTLENRVANQVKKQVLDCRYDVDKFREEVLEELESNHEQQHLIISNEDIIINEIKCLKEDLDKEKKATYIQKKEIERLNTLLNRLKTKLGA